MATLNSCDRDHMTCSIKNINYLTLFIKSQSHALDGGSQGGVQHITAMVSPAIRFTAISSTKDRADSKMLKFSIIHPRISASPKRMDISTQLL